MTHLSRHCAGCDEETPFEQFHPEAASCPDVPDGDCQEWACSVCGDAFVIGLPLGESLSPAAATRAA
jgi:hypothetical protein